MDFSTVFYDIPGYMNDVSNLLSKREWVIHNFNVDNHLDLYCPRNYLYNSEFKNSKYTLVVDLNIYQFLLNAIKKQTPKTASKNAVALLVFCQISNIEIDPTYAVYEKVNYIESNVDDALNDLELFNNINNYKTEELAMYALGRSNSISVNRNLKIDYINKKEMLLRYRRLTNWDSFYLILLVIIDIRYDKSIPSSKKLAKFLDWVIYEFRMSLVLIVYAIIFFGLKPIKRMMKFKEAQDVVERRKALFNMTWDIYIMDKFFEKWRAKTDYEEFMFASDDKAFREILCAAIRVQKELDFDCLKNYLTNPNFDLVNDFAKMDMSSLERVFESDDWTPEYRQNLITKYEEKLFKDSCIL